MLLDEFDADPAAGEFSHDPPQVVQIAGETVHRVHDHRVAGAYVPQQLIELGPVGVFCGRLVGEYPIGLDAVELAIGVLVDSADPDVADSHHRTPRRANVSGWNL
ncbi:Uncharacterised protein [Mycobacteroides abscessus subsp. abscessus]|nr:Uncharacterised protein [Mycobacteroides abscessus subsp. abscessus]